MAKDYDVVVVGAGPNGLTAAARLARTGRRVVVFEGASTIGGGSRTRELAPGARYDVCAAVHPFGASSPAFDALDLAAQGLEWCHAPVALAQPFDDGSAAVLRRDLAATCAGLGADGERWRRIIGRLAEQWPQLRQLALGPVISSLRQHPVAMTRFGLRAGLPATIGLRSMHTREARALLAGFAAHTGTSFAQPTTTGVALALAAAAHAVGMPVAKGGSQSIVDALARVVIAAGGEIVCDHPVASLGELPSAKAVVLDLTPHQVAALAGRPRPRWKHGVAAWKLDLLLAAPLPWSAAVCAEAGTVHVGGDQPTIAATERATARGMVPDQPFVIVAQPSVADPTRAPSGQHVVWSYRHVPNGCTAQEATAGIEAQFDRFAPGWRDLVLHRQITTAADYAAYNPNYIGGDIAGGAMTAWQTIARPRLSLDPYRTKVPGVWICSQSTPPGPGVHGMCGWHAAASVERHT